MNEGMSLEKAIEILKKFCEYENSIVLTENILYKYQEAIETVLQELDKLQHENENLKTYLSKQVRKSGE